MIAVLAAGALGADPVDAGADLDRLQTAAAACERAAVSRAWTDEQKRHGDFVIAAVREQAAIAAARDALADRRRASRAAGGVANLTALAADGSDLDERQRALDDRRRLDTMRQDAVVYFRQLYVAQCNGRDR